MPTKPRILFFGLRILLAASLLLGGCAPQGNAAITPTRTTTSQPPQTQTSDAAAMEETPTPFPTPESIGFFIHEPIPDALRVNDLPGGIQMSSDPKSSLWFGTATKAPAGDVLHTAHWIYALAAPFPTLVDSISLDALHAFWLGYQPSGFRSVTKLYLPDVVAADFTHNWGEYVSSNIVIYESPPAIDSLWEQNAWAVLPFEGLHPKLKVIQLDGLSPLHKDFSPETYPLALTYQLVQRTHSESFSSDGNLSGIISSLPTTNRDPEKMTTLVMTGVTALVRATAAKMETKGIRYPGEDIRPWLAEADLTHISNEVSFYEACPEPDPNSRSLFFCSDPKYIELLEYVGADIIELTGNHNNDILHREGKYLVPYNLKLYQEHGMSYFGGGTNLVDARTPLTLTHNGNRLAFIGCNAPGPNFAWANQYRGGAAPCGDYQWMVEEIQRLKSEGYLPIATFQYYEDYYNFAESHHLRDFSLIANAGAVIVNGSQAHRPKAMGFMGETLVDFGLGNLFFDQMGYTDMYGNNLQQVRWEKIQRHTFYDGRLLSTEILTAMLEDYAQPRPMTLEERWIFLEEIFSASNWDSR
jgi:poly-gamma-glutamate synthesis protein (capsule biosynthesis protein)